MLFYAALAVVTSRESEIFGTKIQKAVTRSGKTFYSAFNGALLIFQPGDDLKIKNIAKYASSEFQISRECILFSGSKMKHLRLVRSKRDGLVVARISPMTESVMTTVIGNSAHECLNAFRMSTAKSKAFLK